MTVSFIRSTLWSLYYRRKHTIQRMREGGRCLRLECEALEALKVQLEASKQWSLKSHITMVMGLRNHIAILMRVRFRPDKGFESKIIDLLTDCNAIQQQPTLF